MLAYYQQSVFEWIESWFMYCEQSEEVDNWEVYECHSQND